MVSVSSLSPRFSGLVFTQQPNDKIQVVFNPKTSEDELVVNLNRYVPTTMLAETPDELANFDPHRVSDNDQIVLRNCDFASALTQQARAKALEGGGELSDLPDKIAESARNLMALKTNREKFVAALQSADQETLKRFFPTSKQHEYIGMGSYY